MDQEVGSEYSFVNDRFSSALSDHRIGTYSLIILSSYRYHELGQTCGIRSSHHCRQKLQYSL